MADLSRAVQTAIYNRLMTAGLAHPVVTVVPDELKPPATVISDSAIEEIGGKTNVIERHVVTVRTFTVGTSKLPLLAAMASIKAALHQQPMTFAGVSMTRCEYLSGAERRDLDEGVLLGEQQFVIFAQDA
jgi:hypothetical protein